MNILDHVFFLIVAVVLPIVGYVTFQRLLRRVAAGEQVNPMHLYRTTALAQWALFVVLVMTWFLLERPFAELGFTLDAGEMTGSINTELDGDDEATELVVTLGIEAKGLLSSMFFGVIRDAVGRGLPAQVDEFATRIGS